MSDAKSMREMLPETCKTNCEDCGAEVVYLALKIDGRVFVPKRCETCARRIEDAEMDRLRVMEEPSREEATRVLHEVEWRQLCPAKYRTAEEGGETVTARLPARQLARVLEWNRDQRPRGLLLHGPTDKGKTRCLWRLVRRLFDEGLKVRVFDCLSFGHECSRAFGRQEDEEWLDGIRRADVVVFDDLWKMSASERVDAELFGLIEWLSAHCRPLFITTNATESWLTRRAADPASRLSADRALALLTRLKLDCLPIEFL